MVDRATSPAHGHAVALINAGGYQVSVAPGLLDRVGEFVAAAAPAHRYAVVSDSNVAPLYAARVVAQLSEMGEIVPLCTMAAGEAHKTRETWTSLTDQLLEAKLSRIFEKASSNHQAEFRGGGGIAVAADGTIYVDANAGVFSPVGGILAIRPDGQVRTLWLSRIRKY